MFNTFSRRTGILFFLFSAALIYGVFFMGVPISQVRVEDRRHRDIFLLAVGLLGIVGAIVGSLRSPRLREQRIIAASAIAIPCYALFQILPLPIAAVSVLSPVRGQLLSALTPITGPHNFASLSIVPSATFTHFLLIAAYCVLFFAAWKFAERARERAWIVAAPVVLAAAMEALLGLLQLFSGADNVVARGTYPIRNHFSGLLELVLPFPAMYSWFAFRRSRVYGESSGVGPIAAGVAITALLAVAMFGSLSRGGLVAGMTSAIVIAVIATNWKMPFGRKVITACLFFLLAAVAIFYLTPMALVTRFSEHNTAGRYSVWKEAVGILAQYPAVGCGLGGFESAFLRFKTFEGSLLVDYAHNDYLQGLAELGIAGFLLILLFAGAISQRVLRMADETSEIRWVALACVGSLSAIMVHSALDFNLYVAANAAVLAWICGLAAGLTPAEPAPRAATEREPVSLRRPTPFR